jgi:glycosyltransferase involved in cell wall biosynthesis
MDSGPLFSIVTPSYNQGRFIRQTLHSVAAQRGASFEHIVRDNLSTDATAAALEEYRGKIIVAREKDNGQADAINRGWREARGQWLAWLNADDVLEPDALAAVAQAARENPDARWIVGRFRIINADGKPIGKLHSGYKNFLLRWYSYNLLLSENIIPQMSVFIRRDLWQEVGELRTDDPLAFDYEYWLRLGKIAAPLIVPQVLSAFRYYPGTKTATSLREQFGCGLRYARQYAGDKRWPVWLHTVNYYKTVLLYDLVKKM